jgi:predicted RNA-binding protein YlxR (DUF448 family)
MCIVCRKRRKKSEMLRFTRTFGEGTLVHDKKNRAGKGLYVCLDGSCFKSERVKIRRKWNVES